MLGAGCWVLGVGCWVLGVGCWVLGVGCWVLMCAVLGAAILYVCATMKENKPDGCCYTILVRDDEGNKT